MIKEVSLLWAMRYLSCGYIVSIRDHLMHRAGLFADDLLQVIWRGVEPICSF